MERNFVLGLLLGCVTWQVTIGQTNLLKNPSFEEDLVGNWVTNGFNMERYTTEALDGTYSIKCSGRYVLIPASTLQIH